MDRERRSHYLRGKTALKVYRSRTGQKALNEKRRLRPGGRFGIAWDRSLRSWIFDVAGPLAVYYGARSVGLSTVVALMLSGVLPAVRVIATVLRHRRLDAIGTLVLSGIVRSGTVTGLVTGSARLYLIDGLVPTVVLGVVCLASLLSSRPMMFRIALETMGEQSSKGQAFVYMWRYHEFRRMFRIITAVWGLMFLTESFVQAAIIGTASINTHEKHLDFPPTCRPGLTFGWTRVDGPLPRAGIGCPMRKPAPQKARTVRADRSGAPCKL